jgi:hypothetical protein
MCYLRCRPRSLHVIDSILAAFDKPIRVSYLKIYRFRLHRLANCVRQVGKKAPICVWETKKEELRTKCVIPDKDKIFNSKSTKQYKFVE